MSASAAVQTRLVIVAATGTARGYALRCGLDNPSVGVVTVIDRGKLDISRPKRQQVVRKDFADCRGFAKALSNQEAVVFRQGIYTGAAPEAGLCIEKFGRWPNRCISRSDPWR